MKPECPLNNYFTETRRGITYWSECGTIIGWSDPIKLTSPYEKLKTVGGSWIFLRDKDKAKLYIHPKMITICKECPKNCPKK